MYFKSLLKKSLPPHIKKAIIARRSSYICPDSQPPPSHEEVVTTLNAKETH